MNDKQMYVVGLLFSDDLQRVGVLHKQHPEWQRGMINGPGGKVEPEEHPDDAMVREFAEETGVTVQPWELCVMNEGPDFGIWFYRSRSSLLLDRLGSPTDEQVEPMAVQQVLADPRLMPSLRWIIPFCQDPVVGLPIWCQDAGEGRRVRDLNVRGRRALDQVWG